MRSLVFCILVTAILALACAFPIAGCDTALLVIDMQNLWVETDGWLTIREVDIVTAVATVVASARDAGLPILYVKDVSLDYATKEQLDFPDTIDPQSGETVIEKTHRSAFTETRLRQVLDVSGITRLLICGIASGACVSATVNEARELDYEIVIVADAHSGGSNGKIAAFRNRMWMNWGIPVLLTEEIGFPTICAPAEPAPLNDSGALPL